MSYKFYGGVHPSPRKNLTSDGAIKRVFVPKRVVLPLSQHTGSPAEPIVKTGDAVNAFSEIAKATGFVSSPVHASISGKVTKISNASTPTSNRALSVFIESQGDEDQDFKIRQRRDPNGLSGEELISIIKDAGIVGLGGAAFPTHVKLSPPKNRPVDIVILNGAECEPYLTCDQRLMIESPKEILEGLEIILRVLNAKNAYIAIEDNKQPAIYAMEKALKAFSFQPSAVGVKIIVLRTKYPQGAEKQIIKSILNRTVPAGGLPMDVGCVVQNVQTAYAIYEAVYSGKPLAERAITLTGSCLKEPVNIRVRIGTMLTDLVDFIGGFKKEPKKIIMGGPMMGLAQYTMDVPIIKGTSGVLFLSEEEVLRDKESVCIRCGKCIETCPMQLSPTTLMYRVKREFFGEAKDLGIAGCFECGACAYECPAKIPLLDYMKYGKARI
ncbi:MAG: electron transport complex subunit RsxC [Candidatus Omnitrophota bacterium]|nr:electron transport complex subunit RsxC [Candidatus Omnitrophota bacterium]